MALRLMMRPPNSFPMDILIVDDELEVRTLLERLLARSGLHLVTAATGQEAIRALKTHPFGCAIIDKNLGREVNGLEVLQVAREEQPHCAAIIITAYGSTQSAVDALRLGATDYILKPFDDLHLVERTIMNGLELRRHEFERDELLRQLRYLKNELLNRDREVARQRSEIDLFNDLLEQRVAHATEDLQNKVKMLEGAIERGITINPVLIEHTESILTYVRNINFNDASSIGLARVLLMRVARQLEGNLDLLRRAAD